MADLNSFAVPVLGTGYVDVVDSLRANINAAMTGVSSGRSGAALGATNLSGPNTYDRTLTQYNGTAYTGFNLKVDKLTVNGGLDLNSGGAQITSNATDTVFFGASGGNYIQYVKGTATWNFVVGGLTKFSQNASNHVQYSDFFRRVSSSDLYETQERQGNSLDGKIWKTVTTASGQLRFIVNDADSVAYFHDEILRTGTNITTRQLLRSSGRLLVGQGLTDDGATMLQTGTLKATSLTLTAQPYASIAASNRLSSGAVTSEFLNVTGIDSQVGTNFSYISADQSIMVNEAGVYLLTGTVGSQIASPNTQSLVRILINGASGFQPDIVAIMNSIAASEACYTNLSCLIKLNALDKFKIHLAHFASAQSYLTLAPTKLRLTKLT